jgi:hypothetical protein
MLICVLARLAETKLLAPRTHDKLVIYENIDNIKAENHSRLIEDLVQRTGLDIYRFEIEKIDFLRDTAFLRVFYHENSATESASVNITESVSTASPRDAVSKEG